MFDFPNSPTLNQQVVMPDGTVRQWDGTKWKAGGATATGPYLPLSGGAMSGAMTVVGNAAAALQPVPLQQLSSTLATTAPALNNVGRSLIHNGLMNIQQRGAGPFASGGYTADRWICSLSLDTTSIVLGAFGSADITAIGDNAAQWTLSNTFTGNAGASAFNMINQRMENVRRLGGKTVIISFYAKASSAALKLGISCDQFFGSGGSPSASVLGTGQAVALTTAWGPRYSVTIALPDTALATLGTNNDHWTSVDFWMSSGANTNTRAGGIGVQSGVISLWGIQLEIAQPGQTQPTPLEKLDPVLQLQQCQRFYSIGMINLGGYTGAGGGNASIYPFPVWMRASPTITPSFSTQTNCGSSQINSQYNGFGYQAFTVGTALGQFSLVGTFTASADL